MPETSRKGLTLAQALMGNYMGVPQSEDYDMEAFLRAYLTGQVTGGGINPNDGRMHYPDTYKLPNHPSFSRESMYGRFTDAPDWVGGKLPNGGESWQLRTLRDVYSSEAPWIQGGVTYQNPRLVRGR